MSFDAVPVLSFALVTSFTPGPNNISCASMGILYGYARSLRYMLGIMSGFFCVMLASAFVASWMLAVLPAAEPVLRMIGAAYILWLAYGTARASYTFDSNGQPPLGFKRGFFLQALNPKGIIYGLTLFSTFMAPVADQHLVLLLFTLVFVCIGFCSISTWTLCGAAIRTHLRHDGVRTAVNLLLAALLVYTAVELSGVLAFL